MYATKGHKEINRKRQNAKTKKKGQKRSIISLGLKPKLTVQK